MESNAQERAAEAYLQEQRGKMRVQGFWATLLGCCGCALGIFPLMAVAGALFL